MVYPHNSPPAHGERLEIMPFIGASVKHDLARWPGARANEARANMTSGIWRAAGAMLPEAGAKTALRGHSPTRRLDNMIKDHIVPKRRRARPEAPCR